MPGEIAERLLAEFNVSRESSARLETYVDLLLSWQRRVNLIGPSTVNDIWTRHVIDALQLLRLIPDSAKVIADLGSGAGLPGLVLAIAGGYEVHLFESNNKKAAFLREASRQTRATAFVHAIRIEDIGKTAGLPKVDVVTARALAPLDRLLDLAAPFLSAGAVGLFHKGRDIEAELTGATKYWRLTSVKHPSVTDSNGVILEVKEAARVT
jgi:16S rRNA (guanine527-N7)-methyltransferase